MTYSGYGDLNEADYKSDVYTPVRIVQTLDGQQVLDLTVQKTNTHNPYILIPVPESVQRQPGGEEERLRHEAAVCHQQHRCFDCGNIAWLD
jgi:hypothetical protein